MQPMLNIAVRAAREAGKIIMYHYERLDNLTISAKARNDFVSEVDMKTEQTIIQAIHKAYPDHAILAEESGTQGHNEFEWIIDPLDGTTNFLHGFPQFAVSIALRHKGRLTQGVVYDPVSQDLFTASRGGGAALNERRIRVSNSRTLEGSLLGTGFPIRQQEHLDMYLETFKSLFQHCSGVRRPGAASLDLAYVAAGRLDGFWELGLHQWDMAAGALLILEAGGIVGDFAGDHKYLEKGHIVAGNPRMFKAILSTIRPHLKPEFFAP